MSHTETNAYEVVLGPPAIRAVVSLPDPADRKELAAALRTELMDGPNVHNELRFDKTLRVYSDRGRAPYAATPLSFAGYTAVHRRLTGEELRRLKREQDRPTAGQGVYVIDILPAESAFIRAAPPLA